MWSLKQSQHFRCTAWNDNDTSFLLLQKSGALPETQSQLLRCTPWNNCSFTKVRCAPWNNCNTLGVLPETITTLHFFYYKSQVYFLKQSQHFISSIIKVRCAPWNNCHTLGVLPETITTLHFFYYKSQVYFLKQLQLLWYTPWNNYDYFIISFTKVRCAPWNNRNT